MEIKVQNRFSAVRKTYQCCGMEAKWERCCPSTRVREGVGILVSYSDFGDESLKNAKILLMMKRKSGGKNIPIFSEKLVRRVIIKMEEKMACGFIIDWMVMRTSGLLTRKEKE